MFKMFIGIDIAKDWVDIHLNTKFYKVLESNVESFISNHKHEFQEALCIMESTGGYEINLARHLMDQGIAVHIAHPNQVAAFMKAKNRLAKTDPIDALRVKLERTTWPQMIDKAMAHDFLSFMSGCFY